MKAGTATKLVLNTITTECDDPPPGKTYGNLMWSTCEATNAKLTARSERIVAEVWDLARGRA